MEAHDLVVRWAIQRDLSGLVDIDRACFEAPMSSRQWRSILADHEMITVVALTNGLFGDPAVGYMCYQRGVGVLNVYRIAVLPAYQRRGIARRMLHQITKKVLRGSRDECTCLLDETQWQAQLLLDAAGFRLRQVFTPPPLPCEGCHDEHPILEYVFDRDEGAVVIERILAGNARVYRWESSKA